MKIPEPIKAAILNRCQPEGATVSLLDATTRRKVGSLQFDNQGFSKTIDEKIYILSYIERLTKYARRDIMIFVNDTPLDQISPMALPVAG